jgi:hypothetical protein
VNVNDMQSCSRDPCTCELSLHDAHPKFCCGCFAKPNDLPLSSIWQTQPIRAQRLYHRPQRAISKSLETCWHLPCSDRNCFESGLALLISGHMRAGGLEEIFVRVSDGVWHRGPQAHRCHSSGRCHRRRQRRPVSAPDQCSISDSIATIK